MWEVFLYVGWLRKHGKTSNVWEDFPQMGRLPTYGKTSQICEGVDPNYGGYTPAGPRCPPVCHLSAILRGQVAPLQSP
jgi:hypothetical protein